MTNFRRETTDGSQFGIADVGRSAVDKRCMARGGKIKIGLLTIALGCLAGTVKAADQPSRHTLSYRNDRLSVRLTRVPLQDIVTEIGDAAGAQISGTVRDPRDVSAEFDDVPLEEALHRLLGEQNFVLKYGKGDRLRAIKLVGGPQAPMAKAQIVPAPTSGQTSTAADPPAALTVPHDVDGAIALLDKMPPIPVSGGLAQAVGTEKATLRQLFTVASNSDDSTVRADAMRAFVGAMDSQ